MFVSARKTSLHPAMSPSTPGFTKDALVVIVVPGSTVAPGRACNAHGTFTIVTSMLIPNPWAASSSMKIAIGIGRSPTTMTAVAFGGRA